MESEHRDIEAAYVTGDMITVCWEPDCKMHRLYFWPEEKWVEHDKKWNYDNFTHSICEMHYQMYHEELNQRIAEELDQTEEVELVATAA